MAFDGVAYRVSIAEAHGLREQEFRDLFCAAISQLLRDSGIRALDIAFLKEGRAARDFTTSEMRQIALAHQNLRNQSAPKALHQPEALTLVRARNLLAIGAERGLNNLFCEAFDALNAWRGPGSPLPTYPAAG
jgi:hypothetical protein